MGLADVHAHLTHPRLAADEAGVLERARAAGVTTIVANGLNPRDNEAVRELARRSPMVRPGFGLYPVDAVLPEMRALGAEYPREGDECTAEEGIAWVAAHAEEAFAIGEIGLDGHWVPESLWAKQEEAFRALVGIALAADKPIVVHTRKRERRAFEILRELGATRVDWHCFGGKVSLARQIAEHGHTFSIPANARRSESFTRMLETLPRDRLLLETDCPYLSPDRSRSNEPATVAGTAEYAAELWGCSVREVEERLADNFERLFRAPP
ncbi:MAG TPA: TatD family hydrolase [Candidatus Binatia bacterium]|nr:TatD family hydrolase [Candidatus Binatia bacterium]